MMEVGVSDDHYDKSSVETEETENEDMLYLHFCNTKIVYNENIDII